MFPITLRHKECVNRLLKKAHGYWCMSLISIRPKKCVIRQLRNTHGYWSMFLVILKNKTLRQLKKNPHKLSKKRRAQKAKIKEELMPIAWHTSRWWDWCVPEDEKKRDRKIVGINMDPFVSCDPIQKIDPHPAPKGI